MCKGGVPCGARLTLQLLLGELLLATLHVCLEAGGKRAWGLSRGRQSGGAEGWAAVRSNGRAHVYIDSDPTTSLRNLPHRHLIHASTGSWGTTRTSSKGVTTKATVDRRRSGWRALEPVAGGSGLGGESTEGAVVVVLVYGTTAHDGLIVKQHLTGGCHLVKAIIVVLVVGAKSTTLLLASAVVVVAPEGIVGVAIVLVVVAKVVAKVVVIVVVGWESVVSISTLCEGVAGPSVVVVVVVVKHVVISIGAEGVLLLVVEVVISPSSKHATHTPSGGSIQHTILLLHVSLELVVVLLLAKW